MNPHTAKRDYYDPFSKQALERCEVPVQGTAAPVMPKDEVLHAIAGLLCVANEILAAWAPVLKCEAAIRADEKCKEAIEKGCYPPSYPGYPPQTGFSASAGYYRPAEPAAPGVLGKSAADQVWTQLAALLHTCTYAAQQFVASYKRQPYSEPEDASNKATEEEQKAASRAPRSGPK